MSEPKAKKKEKSLVTIIFVRNLTCLSFYLHVTLLIEMASIYTEEELEDREFMCTTIQNIPALLIEDNVYNILIDICNILKHHGIDILTFKEKEQMSNMAKIIYSRYIRDRKTNTMDAFRRSSIAEAIQFLVNLT